MTHQFVAFCLKGAAHLGRNQESSTGEFIMKMFVVILSLFVVFIVNTYAFAATCTADNAMTMQGLMVKAMDNQAKSEGHLLGLLTDAKYKKESQKGLMALHAKWMAEQKPKFAEDLQRLGGFAKDHPECDPNGNFSKPTQI